MSPETLDALDVVVLVIAVVVASTLVLVVTRPRGGDTSPGHH
ncbi:MAG TPA: hypothetical protein VK908_17455 [Jiangellales bacterium]|jgi:hypothetical protein|nr:hypothetical protein [Jiangellales bacterium]